MVMLGFGVKAHCLKNCQAIYRELSHSIMLLGSMECPFQVFSYRATIDSLYETIKTPSTKMVFAPLIVLRTIQHIPTVPAVWDN